ncbi:MAG: riboflavin biosynthesis protein RibF [Bdellovibrionales bacterium]|nr:riboflavin biosynthesis protein RibF [Bdellovibrionales bacterium]
MSTSLLRFPSVVPVLNGSQNPAASGTVCTIGNFDGLHRGHLKLLGRVREVARERNLSSAVLSFYPHPLQVLRPEIAPKTISPLRESLRILGEERIDLFYLIRFTRELAEWPPERFLTEILSEKLRCSFLVIGPDAHIGKDRAGTPEVLSALSERMGWGFEVASLLAGRDGKKIGSRQIRDLLLDGEVETAAELLGRDFVIEGYVRHGDGRGRTIGVPTANVHQADPPPLKKGVYAAMAVLPPEVQRIPAVVNVGERPTFGGEGLRVEAHLLDGNDWDLYGRYMRLELKRFLRPEKKFSGVEELVHQIKADIVQARELLK